MVVFYLLAKDWFKNRVFEGGFGEVAELKVKVGSSGGGAGVAGVSDKLFRPDFLAKVNTERGQVGIERINVAISNSKGVTHARVKFLPDDNTGNGGAKGSVFGKAEVDAGVVAVKNIVEVFVGGVVGFVNPETVGDWVFSEIDG